MVRCRPIVILAALILALQGVLHAWCMPAMAAAGDTVPICTPHGVQLVPAEPGDQPAAPSHDCPACQAGHCGAAFTPPVRVVLMLPVAAPSDATPACCRATAPTRFSLVPPARGPPIAG